MISENLERQRSKEFAKLADIAELVKSSIDLQSVTFDAISSIEDGSIRHLAADKALDTIYNLNQCLSNQLQGLHDRLYDEV